MSAELIDVEGFSAADPVENEDDWLDCVRWEVNNYWRGRSEHDRDGFLCDMAGDPSCLALGHTPDADGSWNEDTHPYGWDGERICPATEYARGCTVCESVDCEWHPFDASALWKAVSEPTASDPQGD